MTQNAIPTEEQVKAELVRMLEAGEITREQAAQKMSNYRKILAGQQPTQSMAAPAQAPAPAEEPQGFGQRVLGDVQALGQIAGSMIAEPLGGLAGMAVGGVTGDGEQAVKAIEAVQNFPRDVIPMNPTAEKRMQQFGKAAEMGVNAVRVPVSGYAGIVSGILPGGMGSGEAIRAVQEQGISDVLGDTVYELTGNEAAAAAAYTAPSAALEALGIKGARQLKGQTFAGAESTLLSTNYGKALQQSTPSIKQLKEAARKLYDEVDASGVKIDQNDYLAFALELNEKLRKQGLNPRVADKLSPKAQAVMQAIEDGVGSDFSFGQFDDMRKLANAGTLDISNPLEQSLARTIKESMDTFVDSQSSKLDVSGVDGVGGKLKQARDLWSRAKKAEVVDEIMADAVHQASGYENGLRIGFRQLLKNKKKLKGFSESEIAAMREIVDGTGVANTFKKISKLGIGQQQQSNMLLGYLGGAGGYALGGPMGAVVLPGLGNISGTLATRLTANKAKMLSDVTKAGTSGKQIVSAYLKNTPAKARNVTELTELLIASKADLGTISGPISQLVQDARFAAEHLTNVGMANFIEAPAFIAATQNQETEK